MNKMQITHPEKQRSPATAVNFWCLCRELLVLLYCNGLVNRSAVLSSVLREFDYAVCVYVL